MLSQQQQTWFDALTRKRENAVAVLQEEGLINVFVSHIVDTYRESAHFIYELLQNADDVKATKVRFVLREDGVLFAHNGTVFFSISDPLIERQQGVNPGHLNAITTFSLSTKKEDIENKIGKFGIGFKSVFQYTDTPHVYNPPFCFKIEKFMIPREIALKKRLFNEGETTIFWLPFDKTDKPAVEAYQEISKKLAELQNPLLFLRNLIRIDIEGNNKRVFTKKTIKVRSVSISEASIEKVRLNNDTVLKFDQKVRVVDKDNVAHNLPINVGFVIEGDKISADDKYKYYFENAWCFFPTRQETKLNYIINAPFILTPNREAMKEGRTENKQLISALCMLMDSAVQSLKELGFITEEFFTTIPIPDKVPFEFRTIGQRLIEKLKKGEFIPTRDGKHIAVADAYVCTEPLLAELLSCNNCGPLQKLTGRSKAKLVFPERKVFSDANLFVFFYQNLSGGKLDLNAGWLGSKYSSDFLSERSEEFDKKFFKYLSERSNLILGKGQPLWTKSFVLAYDGKKLVLVPPRNNNGEPQVFISGKKVPGRYVLPEYLIQDSELKAFFLNVLGFRVPDEFDDFLLSLEKYDLESPSVEDEEVLSDILTIKKYFQELSQNKKDKLIQRLKVIDFLPTKETDGTRKFSNPYTSVVYYPEKQLIDYFAKGGESKTWLYLELFDKQPEISDLKQFFEEIDVETYPYYFSANDNLDGLLPFLENISLSESFYLVNVLGIYQYSIDFRKSLGILRNSEWIYDSAGAKKAANQIKIGCLHQKYPSFFESMHISLGAIVDDKEERYAGLNSTEKEILEVIVSSEEELSPDEIKEALAKLIQEKRAKKVTAAPSITNTKNDEEETQFDMTTPEGLLNSWTKEPLRRTKERIEQDALSGNSIPSLPNSVDFWSGEEEEQYENPGGFVSAPTIGARYKSEQEHKKKQQLEKEIELNSKRNQLIELAHQFEPYSFGWFRTLLELEDNFTIEDRVKRNPIRVVFGKALQDSDGLLILSDAVYIPPTIEDIGEISIKLYFGEDKRTVKGEVVSPKKKELNIKLSNPEQLNDLDLTAVSSVVVEASSPDFILERLKSAFAKLHFEDADNLKSPDVLPMDLNFVFGPPGTGKTTYLSWLIGGKNVSAIEFAGEPITPFMEQEDKKVLVLTPTNKAADVLVERILKNYTDHHDYPEWLIRFGQSETLEHEPVFVGDRTLKPWVYGKCAMVTTIARYPYDFFRVERLGEEPDDWKLKDFGWDVIVFDEASMINQAALLYAVFYARQINPKVQFYIGGDPFQIPPIIQFEFPFWSYLPDPAFDNEGNPIVDEFGEQMAWKQDGGNIYSFVGLMKDDSFTNPRTEPHSFRIHTLTTQYRSLVPIGALFSHYRYGGLLNHYRTLTNITGNPNLAEKKLIVPNLPLAALNVIRFPVKKNGGVYRARTVKGSPYQMYSSIFTVELIRYIQEHAKVEKGQDYRVGIISPYAIQSNIISKLLEKVNTGPIEVVCGTVHGFQGDECNMVIVVLNPPRNITRSPRTFLNKKNILNVAISRARDKMIILSPYDPENEINFQDLHQVRWIERLAGMKPDCKINVKGFNATEIEKALWGSETFIEDNSFPTTHQSVNIYTKAAKRYEIRQDENAIDVQISPEIFEKKQCLLINGDI